VRAILAHPRRDVTDVLGPGRAANHAIARYLLERRAMNENFSLIVMCLFLLGSLAFLAQQLTSYH
jgi:hypothetical protein